MAQHAQLRIDTGLRGLLLRSAQPLAARHQREHQRAAAPVLPQGHRPRPPQRRRPRRRRRRAEHPAPQDPRLENPRRGARRVPRPPPPEPDRAPAARRRARGYRRSGPPYGRASATTAARTQRPRCPEPGRPSPALDRFTAPTRCCEDRLSPGNTPAIAFHPGRSTITACSARSARSATPTTTRWPSASSTRFKTELIADRVWRTRTQLELAIVEYVGWFNHARLHEALGDLPPAEFEAQALSRPATQRTPAAPALTHR